MTDSRTDLDLEALLALWETPTSQDPIADFAAFYVDPVVINDVPTSLADLVARATAVKRAFADSETTILDMVAEDGKIALAFRREATHVGMWPTPLGDVPATGERVTLLGMDILTVEDGRITAIRVLADDLAVLLGAAGHRL